MNNDKVTLVMTYRGVDGYKAGSHGNGRVVIVQAKQEEFKGKPEDNGFKVFFQTWGFCKKIAEAYVYLGDFDGTEDQRFKAFQAMYNVARHLLKDRSKIHIVGCDHHEDNKRIFAEEEGCDFISCECSGEQTLGQIVREILKTVPAESKVETTLKLKEEFVITAETEDGWHSHTIGSFATIEDRLFAGDHGSGGRVYQKYNGVWGPTELQTRQGVNLMRIDGKSLLVGDGSCCSGSTWRLDLNGKVEKVLPAKGFGVEDERDRGDVKCNVYGFARIKGKLIMGGGGCAGTHIYFLNRDDRWEFLPNDPNKYVLCMKETTQGVFVAMGSFDTMEVWCYDGEKFHTIGAVRGSVQPDGICEFSGKVYITSTNSGCISPTTFCNSWIWEVTDKGRLQKVWEGRGGLDGFFVREESLHAFGRNRTDWSTDILRLNGDGWKKLAHFDQSLHFFQHGDTLYAGGNKEKGKQRLATVWTVGQ